MRIHRLHVTAFGPFASEASVDFDALSDAGLFLLTGATGAGKTSILDAVCFALYGAVPGDRQTGKRLRSDQAAEGTGPAVTLEFTVAGRRFRIVRSPTWSRPKKRGTGTTTEQARVVVSERRDGAWQPLATRLDEAGHLVTGLLGMTLSQFCQVQLLPQGRFQAFLRADSDERHRLLQQLFRTTRFEAVERWLRDHRRELRRESARHHDQVAALVSRVSEVSGTPLPDEWDLHRLESAIDALERWCAREADGAVSDTSAARAEVDEAEAAAVAAAGRLDTARDLTERLERLSRARSELESLQSAEPEQRRRLDRLDAGHRAASVLPMRDEWQRALESHRSSLREAADRLADLAALLGEAELSETRVPDLERESAAGAARARAHAPRVEERSRLVDRLAGLDRVGSAVAEELAQLDARADVLPTEIAARRAGQAAAQRAADLLAGAAESADAARDRLSAGRLADRLVAERPEVAARHQESVERAHRLREEWLDLRERRLSGMAAEIAAGLVVGADCPVCGSDDHPHPAQPAPDTPDAAAERAARREVDDAEAERLARAGAVTDLESRITGARDRTGDRPVPVLEREATELRADVERLEQQADTLAAATADLRAAEQEQAEVLRRRTTLRAEHARIEAGVADRRARLSALDDELADVLDGTGFDSVTSLADHLTRVTDLCARVRQATVEATHARDRVLAARDRATEAAERHGFSGPDQAVSAALAADERASLEEQVRHHAARLSAVTGTLADPSLTEVAGVAAPDLPALEGACREAEARRSEARARHTLAATRAERLRSLSGDLAARLDGWTPVRARLEVADGLAALADGSSPDNRLRMRLSGYVLAYRLRQVVDAANERLVVMTDHRYRLEHSGERGAGETRGGLSLRIRDDWSGEARDPVTLSGGETFVVSLALALGLADVIAHEAGGTELDTLFVDEGFGSLDAETLDDVMDTLDSLRDGGRVVGVVSHVPELRDRIPAQLQVRKHRSGSSVAQESVG